MLTLGIETSCDETAVSIVNGRKVLSNAVSSSVRLHKRYGGVVPEIASRFHVEYIVEVLSRALKDSKKTLKDIKLVAVTNGPGLIGALLTGVSFAKSLSYSLGLPLIGVNHVKAHLFSVFLNDYERPEFPFASLGEFRRTKVRAEFPFIGLVVSGGHTALFYCRDIERETLLGQTQDDAVGEAYDKVAKILNLGYPGGPIIERQARLSKDRNRVIFPRSYLEKDSLDFSLSGIKTAVLYYVRKLEVRSYKLQIAEINDICYAFQEAVLDVLVHKAHLAARMKNVKSIVVGGGVAANSRLREKFLEAAKFSGVKAYFPKKKYSLDNAAMVGALGEELYRRGYKSGLNLKAEAK